MDFEKAVQDKLGITGDQVTQLMSIQRNALAEVQAIVAAAFISFNKVVGPHNTISVTMSLITTIVKLQAALLAKAVTNAGEGEVSIEEALLLVRRISMESKAQGPGALVQPHALSTLLAAAKEDNRRLMQ